MPLNMKLIPDIIKEVHMADNQMTGMQTGTQTTEYLHLNNPRNYKFLPPQFVGIIRNAGKATPAGNHVKELMCWYVMCI